MSRMTSFTAYGASAGSILNGVLSYFNPEQWNTIGVLGGIIIATMTFLTNLVFKIRDDRDRRRMIDAYQSKVEK
ncbi:lysis protein [Yersinia enterocolitica]|nr:lysis protein [Yersinia enterocolitica]